MQIGSYTVRSRTKKKKVICIKIITVRTMDIIFSYSWAQRYIEIYLQEVWREITRRTASDAEHLHRGYNWTRLSFRTARKLASLYVCARTGPWLRNYRVRNVISELVATRYNYTFEKNSLSLPLFLLVSLPLILISQFCGYQENGINTSCNAILFFYSNLMMVSELGFIQKKRWRK